MVKTVVRCWCHSGRDHFARVWSGRGTTVIRRLKKARCMTVLLSNAMGMGCWGKGAEMRLCAVVDLKGR